MGPRSVGYRRASAAARGTVCTRRMRRLCVYLSSGRSTYVGRPRLARVADAEKNCYFSSAPDQGDHPGTGDGTNARPERERVPPFGAIRDEAQKQIVIYCK